MDIKKIINNDYVFSIFSKIIGVVTGIVYTALFSRYMGVELKGISAIILNYVAMLSIFFDFGISQSYACFRKDNEKFKYEYCAFIRKLFIVYFFISIVLFVNLKDVVFRCIVLILPIRIFANEINNVIMIETPRKRNVSSIIINVLDIVFIVSLWIVYEANIKLLVRFLLIKEILYLIVACCVVGSDIISSCKNKISSFKLVKYGIGVMISLLMMEINYRIDVIMLDGFVSAENIGLYSVGISLAERVWLIPDAMRDILMSRLAKGKKESEVACVTRVSFTLSLVLVVLVIILGKPLIVIMFGKNYVNAYGITVVIMFGVLSMVFYKSVYAYFTVLGKQKINLVVLVVTAVINICANKILIPIYGTYGAALASVVSYTFCGIAFIVLFKRYTKVSIKDMIFLQVNDVKKIIRK